MSDIDYAVTGFVATGFAAGIKKTGALDLALIVSPAPCRAAAALACGGPTPTTLAVFAPAVAHCPSSIRPLPQMSEGRMAAG